MADKRSMALEELVRRVELEGDVDMLREGVRVLSQALMELELRQHLGGERHERTPERTGQRNGHRDRRWDTRVGMLLVEQHDEWQVSRRYLMPQARPELPSSVVTTAVPKLVADWLRDREPRYLHP